ncbi:MAG: DUF2256 domain-containing protein [Alteromonadaceae bacterium]|nr:DUF2256 domain-containing protein [Alteromonadaceae bacterium]
MKKSNLPTKMCPVCQRPFTWRKKWERDWEHVKYCSKRCMGNRNKIAKSS